MMQFYRVNLNTCAQARGAVVVIDVLRAFTTAGYLFEAGVKEIVLTSTVEEALKLRQQMPGSLLLGEIDGIPIPGFDLGNSPSELSRYDLRGKTVIQRTTAGTQGVVRCLHAENILTAALTNARATATYLERLAPREITFVLTGYFPDEGWGDEDVACADVLEAYLQNRPIDWQEIDQRVRHSRSGKHYDGTREAFPPPDLDMALAVNRFPFAMRVEKKDGLPVLQTVPVD
ncbi:2-phosphosulfolactate phosphatase [Anaerolinea sp.]|uniref:2-phosphosulfolactate phosphatase n=1 Tax=Anaerolinea sp. TaxID=1872519 RepID=UPI002ACD333F|nr:2-phosphosulfolactate phosphatase [Anaerolinea sp.]